MGSSRGYAVESPIASRGVDVQIASFVESRYVPLVLLLLASLCHISTNTRCRQCDEARPRCQKCIGFGIDCSYETGTSEMQVACLGAFQVDLALPVRKPTPAPATIPVPLDLPAHIPLGGALGGTTYQLTHADKGHLARFNTAVMLTVGSESNSIHFQQLIMQLMPSVCIPRVIPSNIASTD